MSDAAARAVRTRAAVPSVVVCRGCCCGTQAKNPGIDHDALLVGIRDAVGAAAQVRVTDCLGPCERANVTVVVPSARGRRAGGRPVWLGYLLDHASIDEVGEWVRAGGPGLADPPPGLDLSAFRAPRTR